MDFRIKILISNYNSLKVNRSALTC